MVEGGAVDTGNNEYLTQGVLEIVQESEDLQEKIKSFLDENKDLKDLDLTEEGSVILLLIPNFVIGKTNSTYYKFA
ncbi:hypothetical protein [Wolbachia endosymbiont of Oedothorax gibbosus]|uniref:hypothetical protein n=1 Tax=Wolbachia endosymbiont of Oedothorax gibbosus TaxID=931100 RepID=UPI002025B19C|nr:hypothetical protein [Wolbachia endosymbiont of Oedothorax gibbosus]